MVSLIDTFVLIKYIVMFSEKAIYSEDYPSLVFGSVIFKFFLQITIVVIQWHYAFRKLQFKLCKLVYGLKFVEIIFALL